MRRVKIFIFILFIQGTYPTTYLYLYCTSIPMAAIYSVYASPTHPPLPNHLPTLIVTPHGNFPSLFLLFLLSSFLFQVNLLISFIPTSIQTLYVFLNLSLLILIPPQNTENYLLTPSPQGDLCVAKLFPPRANNPGGKPSGSDPGHGSPHGSSSRVVRCEASRNLKWSITNTGVISPIYKLALPSPDSPDLPLFQISKPNPNAAFWSMFYFAYAGHNIPPKRIEFGKIQKNPPGPNGGGTRITISGKTPEEKSVWQTLGEGNEDCVEWVVLCAALNLLE
jgi:neural Wiskott-Aldrich syndrome protein